MRQASLSPPDFRPGVCCTPTSSIPYSGAPKRVKSVMVLFCPSHDPQMSEEDNEYVCAALIEAVERVRQEG